jgi:hypothetical protein
MITGNIRINSDTWTEIAGGASRLQFSAKGASGVLLTFTENEVPPDSFAGCHRFGSWPNGFDFDQSGYPEGQRVWAKSISPVDELCITRDTNFHFLFIPDGSDSLITSDGDTFKVLGDG